MGTQVPLEKSLVQGHVIGLKMIQLNCDNGLLHSGHRVLGRPGMNIHELENYFPLEGPTGNDRSENYRIVCEECWLQYGVEAIAVRFVARKCTNVSVHLSEIDVDKGKATADLLITQHLRRCLHASEKVCGKSEVQFTFTWGTLTCMYDFKLAAPSVAIRYK